MNKPLDDLSTTSFLSPSKPYSPPNAKRAYNTLSILIKFANKYPHTARCGSNNYGLFSHRELLPGEIRLNEWLRGYIERVLNEAKISLSPQEWNTLLGQLWCPGISCIDRNVFTDTIFGCLLDHPPPTNGLYTYDHLADHVEACMNGVLTLPELKELLRRVRLLQPHLQTHQERVIGQACKRRFDTLVDVGLM